MSAHSPFAREIAQREPLFGVDLAPEGQPPTCGIHWIARRLGATKCSDARLVRFLASLVAEEGFPPPLPHPARGGGIERGVAARSRWLRVAVEHWLGEFLPDACAATLDAAAHADAAREMDDAAAKLTVIDGGRS